VQRCCRRRRFVHQAFLLHYHVHIQVKIIVRERNLQLKFERLLLQCNRGTNARIIRDSSSVETGIDKRYLGYIENTKEGALSLSRPDPTCLLLVAYTCFVCFLTRTMDRVNELTNIPGSNMEVVIFFVGSDRCSTTADGSSVGSSSGSNRGGERRAPREDGPISVCLWTPTKCESPPPPEVRVLRARACEPLTN